jgi:tetratricopeptide (TPR) repeat protein
MRGSVREELKDRDGAIADYGEAIARDPKSGEALARRCHAWHGAEALDRALQDCDAALVLDRPEGVASIST